MEVNLVAVSKPRIQGVDTAEELVAYTARVSNPANQANKETAGRLVGYLIRNEHWSPLEMVHVVMEIKTTRDIARQILRHRSFSFQEFSQRYAEVVDFSAARELRLQDKANRQNSIETEDHGLQAWWKQEQEILLAQTEELYKEALENGIAKEVARAILPEGLTASTIYMAGTLRSWIHYVNLRSAHGTQKEHMEIATACKGQLIKEFPSIMENV